MKGSMDVGSPENGYDEINDFFKNDDCAFPDDLDLDFMVNKDHISGDYDFGDLTVDDKFHLDIIEPEKPSSTSSFRYFPECPSENLFSSLEDLDERGIIGDPLNNAQNRSNENENLCGSYFQDSIFEMDSESVLCEVQNNVSLQHTDLQGILDRPLSSPACNERDNLECVHRVTDEGKQKEKSSVSCSGEAETKSGEINEKSRESPSGCQESERLNCDLKEEICKSPNTNREILGLPNVDEVLNSGDKNVSTSCTSNERNFSPTRCTEGNVLSSPDNEPNAQNFATELNQDSEQIDNRPQENANKSPEVEIVMVEPPEGTEKLSSGHEMCRETDHGNRARSMSPSCKTDCNEPLAKPDPSASESGKSQKVLLLHEGQTSSKSSSKRSNSRVDEGNVMSSLEFKPNAENFDTVLNQESEQIDNRPEENMTKSPDVEIVIVKPSDGTEKSRLGHEMDHGNRARSRLPQHKTDPDDGLVKSCRSANESSKSRKVLPPHEGQTSSKSSKKSNSRHRSKSPPRVRDCVKESFEQRAVKNRSVTGSEDVIIGKESSSSRSSKQKQEPSSRSSSRRRSRSKSPNHSRKKSPEGSDSQKSRRNPIAERIPQLPSSSKLSSNQKPESSETTKGNTSRSRTREGHKRSLETSSHEPKKISASQGALPSISRSDKRKRELVDDKSKRSMQEEPSADRKHESEKVSSRRSEKQQSVVVTETRKRKRSRSRSPHTGESNKRLPRKTGFSTGLSSNSQKASVSQDSLWQKDSSVEKANLGKENTAVGWGSWEKLTNSSCANVSPEKNSGRENPLPQSSSRERKPKDESGERSNRDKELVSNNRHSSSSAQSSKERASKNSSSDNCAPASTEPSSSKHKSMKESLLQVSSSSRERKKKNESADRGNFEKEHVSVERKRSASPRSSRQRIGNSPSGKCGPSTSPKNNRRHRRRGRSVSPSHLRRKDSSSSGCKEDIRVRSRSRSRDRRDSGTRSPRRRRSSRNRSPPSSIHSLRSTTPRSSPWTPHADRDTGIGKPGRNLFIAGFSFATTERDLERKFSRFGRIRDIRVVRDRLGEPRGFGFITYERDDQADAAIKAVDNTEWGGRIVLVEKSKSQFL